MKHQWQPTESTSESSHPRRENRNCAHDANILKCLRDMVLSPFPPFFPIGYLFLSLKHYWIFMSKSQRETRILSSLPVPAWKTLASAAVSSVCKTPRGSWSFAVTDKPGNLFLCSANLTAHQGKRTDPSCCSTRSRLSFLIASWYTSWPVSSVMKWCDFNQLWLHLALKVYSVWSLEAHYHSAPFQGRSLFFIRVRKTGVLLSHYADPKKDLKSRWLATDFILSNCSYIVNRAVCNSIL